MISSLKKATINNLHHLQPGFHESHLELSLVEEPEPERRAVKKKMKEMKKKEPQPWDYKDYDNIEATLNSLDVFLDWKNEDGEKMPKKDIRESYDNFDEWLRVVAEKYKAEYKRKEDTMFD